MTMIMLIHSYKAFEIFTIIKYKDKYGQFSMFKMSCMTTEGKSHVKYVKFYVAEYSHIPSKVMIRSQKVILTQRHISTLHGSVLSTSLTHTCIYILTKIRGRSWAPCPLTAKNEAKNEAPAPKFYKIEAPDWQFQALK